MSCREITRAIGFAQDNQPRGPGDEWRGAETPWARVRRTDAMSPVSQFTLYADIRKGRRPLGSRELAVRCQRVRSLPGAARPRARPRSTFPIGGLREEYRRRPRLQRAFDRAGIP